MEPTSNISTDVRTRILTAIETLYDELGRGEKFPSASDVRALARVDMNACSKVVTEWRRQQTAKPAPVAVNVPETVMQAHHEATILVWSAAQEQANASLRDAEQKWDLERRDNESMRLELAEAYEASSNEADRAREALAEALRSQDELRQQNQTLSSQLATAREALATQTSRADENERRADDLKGELQVAHEAVEAVRKELSQARQTHLLEIETHRSAASVQLAAMSEKMATVSGRLDAATEQLAARSDEARELQVELARAEAQRDELQRSHATLQAEFAQTKKLADDSSRELAKNGGVLQEIQRQNDQLLERLKPVPTKAAKAKPERKPGQ